MRFSSLLATQLWAAILGVVPPVGAATYAVEVLFLVDTEDPAVHADPAAVRELYTDLVKNLPDSVRVRDFRLGGPQGIRPLDRAVDNKAQEGPPQAARPLPGDAVRRGLAAGQALLCAGPPDNRLLGKVIVLVGGSPPPTPLDLIETCPVVLLAVSTHADDDSQLRRLAQDSGGIYRSLATASGFTLATFIKKKVWLPSLLCINQSQSLSHPSPKPVILYTGALAALLLSFLLTLARFLLGNPPRGTADHSPAVISPSPTRPSPTTLPTPVEAQLVARDLLSSSIFPLTSDEPIILGGALHAHTPAQLLIADPLLASEHCQIYYAADSFHIVDLGTDQGTFLNDQLVSAPTRLSDGDVLRLGQTVLVFNTRLGAAQLMSRLDDIDDRRQREELDHK